MHFVRLILILLPWVAIVGCARDYWTDENGFQFRGIEIRPSEVSEEEKTWYGTRRAA